MRKFIHLIMLLPVLCSCSIGAGRLLVLPRAEVEPVEILFRQTIAQQNSTHSVEAEFSATFKSLLMTGMISGYMQALSPSFVKVVGLTALGQPVIVFVSDSEQFRYGIIPESVFYEGRAEMYPLKSQGLIGLAPVDLYFWLAGMLGPTDIIGTVAGADREGQGYWIDIRNRDETLHSQVLFDPERRRIRRRVVLDKQGKILLQVSYDAFVGLQPGLMMLPGQVLIESTQNTGGTIEILLAWESGISLTADDFHIGFPETFKKVEMN